MSCRFHSRTHWQCILNRVPAIVGEVIGNRPIPVPAMMAKSDAAKLQIGIRNERVEICVRAGILAVNITHAGEITLAKLPCDTEIIDEAGIIIQRDGLVSERRVFHGDLLHDTPFGPIQIKLEIPVGRRPERYALDDKLRKVD